MPDGAEPRGRVPRVLGQVGLRVSVELIAAIGALSHDNFRHRNLKRETAALGETGPRDRLAAEMGARQ